MAENPFLPRQLGALLTSTLVLNVLPSIIRRGFREYNLYKITILKLTDT